MKLHETVQLLQEPSTSFNHRVPHREAFRNISSGTVQTAVTVNNGGSIERLSR